MRSRLPALSIIKLMEGEYGREKVEVAIDCADFTLMRKDTQSFVISSSMNLPFILVGTRCNSIAAESAGESNAKPYPGEATKVEVPSTEATGYFRFWEAWRSVAAQVSKKSPLAPFVIVS